MPHKDPEVKRQYMREYNRKNKVVINEKHKQLRKVHFYLVEHNRSANNRRHNELRMKALIAYSGPRPHCECCGEDHVEFMAIDHINNNGKEDRKRFKGFGMLRWLEKNNYPSGYRVLCHNCNLALGFYGYYPHQTEKHMTDNSFLEVLSEDDKGILRVENN